MKPLCMALLVFSLFLGPGCSHKADSLGWVNRARDANLRADQALRQNDRPSAIASLQKVVETGVPAGVADLDARAVRQDACFRLASIELDADRPVEALRWSDRGLELGRGHDLFTANLLVTRGRALQMRGREEEAAKDYHRALLINESLLDQALGPKPERNLP